MKNKDKFKHRYFVHYRPNGEFALMDGYDTDEGAAIFIKRMEIETGEKFEQTDKDNFNLLKTMLHHNAKVETLFVNRLDLKELEN